MKTMSELEVVALAIYFRAYTKVGRYGNSPSSDLWLSEADTLVLRSTPPIGFTSEETANPISVTIFLNKDLRFEMHFQRETYEGISRVGVLSRVQLVHS
jgi:hypothetical protein